MLEKHTYTLTAFPFDFSDLCVEQAITKHEYLTNKERGWAASMTTEENGHDVMKAFLNDQGSAIEVAWREEEPSTSLLAQITNDI